MPRFFGMLAGVPALLLFFSPAFAQDGRWVTFSTGKSSYVVNGSVYSMDALPFVENGRTFVTVRYLGYALGLAGGTSVGTRPPAPSPSGWKA